MFGVGDVVRKLRLERNWTIDELARRAAINKMTVSAIERGYNHTRTSLDAVARALGLENASGLDARLHEWASKLATPASVNDAVREWLEIYDAFQIDREAYRDILRFLRRYARDVRKRPGPPSNSPAPTGGAPVRIQGTVRRRRTRTRR